jgi:hypothetical protein
MAQEGGGMDDIPFGHPPIMNGYPLDRCERQALDEVLAVYRRRDEAEHRTAAETRSKTDRRSC